MAESKRERVRNIDLEVGEGTFTTFFRKFGITGAEKAGINFKDVSALRQLLSNEKARILYVIQRKKPSSIYELAKILRRDFKSVRKDVELLKNFDMISFIKEGKGKRQRLRPVLNLDVLNIKIKI